MSSGETVSASHFALGATMGAGDREASLPLSGLLEAPHTHTNEQLALKEIKNQVHRFKLLWEKKNPPKEKKEQHASVSVSLIPSLFFIFIEFFIY